MYSSIGENDVSWFSLSIGDKDLPPVMSLSIMISISNLADNQHRRVSSLGLGYNVSRNSLSSTSQEPAYIDARVSCLYKVNPNSNKTRSPTHNLALVYRLWSARTSVDTTESSMYVLAHQSNPAHRLGPIFKLIHLDGSHFPPLGVPGDTSQTYL